MKLDHQLESYILAHITEEDELLQRLYRSSHLRLVNGRMCSGPLQGSILTFISRLLSPSRILEIGTFTGYSAICLAKGLAVGGLLHTIEINDELESFAASFFEQAGMNHCIIPHIGDASELIPTLEGPFDLAFLDADKRQYLLHYEMVLPKIRKGGVIIADNTLWGGKVLFNPAKNDEQTLSILA
ncbi:MAG: O-methyltransferase, partial [Marinilabiliales bacterium]|nr:O-methyltransferase [Marinilabiliales bacterium]